MSHRINELLVAELRQLADTARAAARSITGTSPFDVGRITAYDAIARAHEGRITELLNDGCGTDAGYYRHLRREQPTCPRCCAAHAEVERLRTQARRTAA